MITITLEDHAVQAALDKLRARLADMTPVMADIGEELVARTKDRFASSTGPDGQPWAPNRPSTVAAYLGRFSGSFKKDGSLSKKGQARSGSKKPLIGESRMLSQQISAQADRSSVVVGSSRIYAGTQQFGAKQGAFGRTRRGGPIPWGDIPARPFLPVTPDHTLYAAEIPVILAILQGWLDKTGSHVPLRSCHRYACFVHAAVPQPNWRAAFFADRSWRSLG